jgi:hypothetical protein
MGINPRISLAGRVNGRPVGFSARIFEIVKDSSVDPKDGIRVLPATEHIRKGLGEPFLRVELKNNSDKTLTVYGTLELVECSQKTSYRVDARPDDQVYDIELPLILPDEYNHLEVERCLTMKLYLHGVSNYGPGDLVMERNLRIQPVRTFPSLDCNLIGCWCSPCGADGSVMRLVEQANTLKGFGGFTGYQSSEADLSGKNVMKQMQVLYDTVKKEGVKYLNSPVSFSSHTQRVRPPSEVLSSKAGNCLELAVLFASLFEAVNLQPLLVFEFGEDGGHAYVAVRKQPGRSGEETHHSDLIFLECTCVNNTAFADAIELGTRNAMAAVKKRESLDLKWLRQNNITPSPLLTSPYPFSSTLSTPGAAARSKAETPSESGYTAAISGATSSPPDASSARASSIGPQREPISVTSFTTRSVRLRSYLPT